MKQPAAFLPQQPLTSREENARGWVTSALEAAQKEQAARPSKEGPEGVALVQAWLDAGREQQSAAADACRVYASLHLYHSPAQACYWACRAVMEAAQGGSGYASCMEAEKWPIR